MKTGSDQRRLLVFPPVSLDHVHAIVHVLDGLESGVDAGGFGEGFHEGIEPLLSTRSGSAAQK
jgi:hypothetical protein